MDADPESTARPALPLNTSVGSSFLVDLTGPEATTEGAEFKARIRQVDDLARALDGRGFKLGDAVLDVVSDLLVQLVREDGNGD